MLKEFKNTPEQFYELFKSNKPEIMRLALAGDGFISFVTSLFAIDLDMSQADRSYVLGQLRSNRMMEAYVNEKKLWQDLPSGKTKADWFEAYIGYNLILDLSVNLFLDEIEFIEKYIEWAYPKIKANLEYWNNIENLIKDCSSYKYSHNDFAKHQEYYEF